MVYEQGRIQVGREGNPRLKKKKLKKRERKSISIAEIDEEER